MFLLRLKKRRRGQIRAVDFVVSLFLFLIMLTQLILIIVNVQTGIKSTTTGTLTYEELDIFGRQLLLEEGDNNWGYKQNLPSTFGLADSNSLSSLVLDASKINRLITGTSLPISPISGFEMYDYEKLKETIGLETRYGFRLGFLPLFETEVRVSSYNFAQVTAQVIVTNPYNTPISDATVYFFTIDLTNGEIISEGSTLTNSSGGTSLQLSNPNLNDPDGEQFVFIIVEKGSLWGMNWGHPDPASEGVFIGPSSSTTIWGGGINSSALLLTDILASTPDSHFISVIYQNTTSGYSNQTIDLTTASNGNTTIVIPNKGLVVFFSISRTNNEYQVGIGSYPAILDRYQASGNFYQVLGELNPSRRVKSNMSKIYPIIVRNTMMRCQIILWSE